MKGSGPRLAARHRPSVSDSRADRSGRGPRQARPRSSAPTFPASPASPGSPRRRLCAAQSSGASRASRTSSRSTAPTSSPTRDRISKTAAIKRARRGGHREPRPAVPPLAADQRHHRDVRQIGPAHRDVRQRPQTDSQVADRQAGHRQQPRQRAQQPARARRCAATAAASSSIANGSSAVDHAAPDSVTSSAAPARRTTGSRPTAAAMPPTAPPRQPPATPGRSGSTTAVRPAPLGRGSVIATRARGGQGLGGGDRAAAPRAPCCDASVYSYGPLESATTPPPACT